MLIFFIRTPEKFNMKKRTLTTNLIFAVLVFLTNGSVVGIAVAAGPSFDCSKAAGSIEQMICKDDVLSTMDHKMAEVYAAATKKAVNEHPPLLKAEQRGWIKGRNDCWESEDERKCAEESYRRRIAELQARYRWRNSIEMRKIPSM
ncbi:MAG: lysozyme inhibitor LprI family protein [Desulfobacterales bacterium]